MMIALYLPFLLFPPLGEGRDGGTHDTHIHSALAPTPALPQEGREQEKFGSGIK